jgi:hypothetical protein
MSGPEFNPRDDEPISKEDVILAYLEDISGLLGTCRYKAIEIDALQPNQHDWQLLLSNVGGMIVQIEAFKKKLRIATSGR